VLEPLLGTGELPHLAELRKRAACGVLESTIPFYTGPAWASFATGTSPGAHGVYDFLMLRDGDALTPARQSDLRRLTYYEQLARDGRRSVLVNLPLDQDECPGAVIVNSWLTVDEARRIHPLDRRERYREQLETYRNYPTTFDEALDVHLEDLCALEQSRFQLARELFVHEEWDHFFCLFSATDWLGHKATGSFLADDVGARAAFLRLYRQLDEHIGWLVENAPDALVLVLSDHGQCAETHVVHLNAVLRDLGFVRLVSERPREVGAAVAGEKRRGGIRVPTALGSLRRHRTLRTLARVVRRSLMRSLKIDLVTPARGLDVDRILSRAFVPTVASYAVHARGCDERELRRIRTALLELRLDDSRPALEGIWTFEELYGRTAPPGAPAFVFAPSLGVRPSINVHWPAVTRAGDPGRGAHQRDGILLLAGPGVRPGPLDATLYDLAPTILWAMGSAVPADADGRVLFEAFDEGFADERELREVEASLERPREAFAEASAEVERRLAALGYL
jgi:predicted AlkP superfamily phosphohydrolase/phosphomutase